MAGSHGGEVPVVESREPGLTESLDDRQYGAVDEPDPKVLVRSHQLGSARMVGRGEVFDVQLAAGDRV